ncbi:MAG: carbohydrate porin [Proteobacteria bacterium]|nr:carbohydrate porin [Pseudomonadota bacterium]
MIRLRLAPLLPALIGLACATPARAEDDADQAVALHGQATLVVQGVGGFATPYAGNNSLAPRQAKETLDLTAYLGLRPWHGAELWANGEIDQGFGLSDTLGVAGFPSAEAYKVGKARPYTRLQRLFLRQTVALGGAALRLDPAANQLGLATTANRLVITVGKFGVGDVFDTNRLAHDPRGDFLNWSVVDTGSFDYAADAWGYSYGAAAEWYQGDWTLRAGLFNLSKVPNGVALETGFGQNQLMAELEHRHRIGTGAGALRLTAFRNHGRFARLDEALAAAGAGVPDPTSVRRPMDRAGLAFNAEQDVTATLALFIRAGASDGAIETYDFTDIDRSLALGGVLAGKGWGRAADSVGLAVVSNAISATRQRFLAAGGLGVLVGDGRLPHPGVERIVEAWYAWRPAPSASVTLDAQYVANPGYNRDRGPAKILALRLHAGF